MRERQEWEKQEAKLRMNGIGSNGLGPVQGQLVQGQGQALSLVTQMGELSAAAVGEFWLLIIHRRYWCCSLWLLILSALFDYDSCL